MWLKNQECHAHFSFEIQLAINPSILELETSPSGFKLLRYRAKNVVFRAKQYLQYFVRNFGLTDFVFPIPAYVGRKLVITTFIDVQMIFL